MKKTITLLLISLLSIPFFSQNTENEILEKLQKYYNESDIASKNKDYKTAVASLDSLINYFYDLPSKEKEIVSIHVGSAFYNNACYYSLLGNKGKALDNFEKAVEYNWNNYAHALQDTDLDLIRNEERFKAAMLELKKTGDFLQILKDAPAYNNQLPKEYITFTYASPSDSNMVRIRESFNLDSIAGNVDEISQIKNLMTWVHNRIRHDGSSSNPSQKNTIDIVKVCDAQNRGVNCRMLATVLNECYLAMGFKSRFVTCMPKEYINDCHVINAVYSETLDKWLWMDPTFNAYVSDENGKLLGIAEVRERLRTDKPVVLNEDANWNNKTKQTKEYYLDSYMAKNLYWLQVPLHSGYNVETSKTTNGYINLYPVDYQPDPIKNDHITTNDKLFWEELDSKY